MSLTLLRRIARFVFGKVLPKGIAYPVLSGPLKGSRFCLGSGAGEGGGARIYFNLVEPGQTRAFVNMVEPGQVVFDIGANIGYYTILASKLVGVNGAVFAFEPAIRNIVYLYRHVTLNKAENVTIVSAACSDSLSINWFSLGANCALGHLAESGFLQGERLGNVGVVPTVTVDEFVRHTGILPDVMKIDVEGAELRVVHGARDTLIAGSPTVFLSVHSSDLRTSCLDFLKGLNYTFETLNGGDKDGTGFLAQKA